MNINLGCVTYNLDGSCRDNAVQQQLDAVAYKPTWSGGTVYGTPDAMLPIEKTIGTMMDPAYSFDYSLTPAFDFKTYGPYVLAAGLAVAALAFAGKR